MAEDVGKRVLGEVAVVGLDEILHTLRQRNGSDMQPFGFPPLDKLLRTISETKVASSSNTANAAPPIIELMSLAAGGGKTHLLYHLCAQAILPSQHGGKQACAAIIDTDGKFSIQRLSAQILKLFHSHPASAERLEDNDETVVVSALRHVHIFRPQSLASAIATLDALPTYLFDNTRHHSYDRQVGFIAIDSASAFYWTDRAETEDAAFFAPASKPQSAYHELFTALKATSKALDCPAIISTWYLGPPTQQPPRACRPQLPGFYPPLRLVVQRVPVRKFPPGMSLEQALREADDRRKAVEEGKFECFVNEYGLDERTLQELQRSRVSGFSFRIREDGVTFEEGGSG